MCAERIVVVSSAELPPGGIRPCTVGDDDAVVFRTASGRLGALARACPHLDRDLSDGQVVGEELVCTAHGWSITVEGAACKRNEFGRVDPKGVTHAWQAHDIDGMIVVDTD